MSKTSGLLDFLAKAGVTLPEEVVHIEQWQRDVVLKGLTSRERDLFEEESLRRANAKAGNGAKRSGQAMQADLANFRARLVSRHIVEDGNRTFANERGEEILGDQPAAVLDRLFSVSQKLSGFSAEDVEALTKNSAVIPENEHSTTSQGSAGDQSVN